MKPGGRRLLVFTNAYPYPELPYYGIFAHTQVEHWREAGVEVDVFFINGRKSRWNYVSGVLAWAWKMLWRGGEYDAIVAHHSYCCLIAGLIKPWGTPLIYQVHEGTIHFWRLNEFLVRLAIRLVDKVVYVSRNLPDYLRYPVAEDDIIPCGVNLELFRPLPQAEARQKLGWDRDAQVVLYAAKERKYYERFELVVEAVEKLRKGGRSVRLVRLEGVIPSEVPVCLNAADVLVVASHGEGSPKIVKEALACDKPVVSLRVGSVAELLEGVSSGFLAEDNAADLSIQLKKALDLGGVGTGRAKVSALSSKNTSRDLLEVCLRCCRPLPGKTELGLASEAE